MGTGLRSLRSVYVTATVRLWWKRAAGIGALVCGLASPAAAQLPGADASIRGRVVDTQGLPVRATVEAVGLATRLTRRTAGDEAGRFTIPSLLPGIYRIDVAAPGFRPRRFEQVTVAVGEVLDLQIELSVSGGAETLTVSAAAAVVDLVSPLVGSVIRTQQIDALPLNGRNFLELAFLAPGNAPAPNFDPTKARSVIVSSGGQLGRGGNITIDGMDNNDDVVGGPLMNISQDAVQEFQVATNTWSAVLGRSAGSVINVVTKSGSDDVHASAALFARDRRWQAAPATLDPAVTDDMPFRRQQLPVTLGGPLRRQQVFGFATLELRNEDGGVLVGSRNVPAGRIDRRFVAAPLDDLLASLRLDWRLGERDSLMLRYAGQRQDDISASTLDRAIGTDSYRQASRNRFHAAIGTWTRVLSSRAVNTASVSISDFANRIDPVAPGVQMTFPSLLAGSSFRVPQGTTQARVQLSDALTLVRGAHQLTLGGQLQRVSGVFDLDVFRSGRIEFVEDFPSVDRNGDGRATDDDLLFAVTLRSAFPNRGLTIDHANNTHVATYLQDDWRVHPRLSVSAGLRYEADTDVNNVSRVGELNPLVSAFVTGPRRRDLDNWAPRLGLNWSWHDGRASLHGGYGVYYDRVTLQIQSLERGLDGRALPIEVRAGNLFFLDNATGRLAPGAPTVSNPFGGFILPGQGASGINVIDPDLQNPRVQQASFGVDHRFGRQVVRADVVLNRGDDFIIGRTVGSVFNPVVGGPDRVVVLASSAKTSYRALLLDYERPLASGASLRLAYTWSRARNYANDDQIPFAAGPIDPNDLAREDGPTPNDQTHRVVASGSLDLGAGVQLSGVWTLASGVPMDIVMPDGQSRVPVLGRNAGGRQFRSGAELNAFIDRLNAAGGVGGQLLPSVSDRARFNDAFSAVDLRVSKGFTWPSVRVEVMAELFNLFNTVNVLGVSNLNYSGFNNVLARDASDPASPGYRTASRFGTPISTAGGVFGSGGPRALQLAARVRF